jgi:hypothetical protein
MCWTNLFLREYALVLGDSHFFGETYWLLFLNKVYSWLGYPFLDTWFKDCVFVIFQIKNWYGINVNKKLDDSNYDHLHGGGSFSHAHVIMHKYFDKKLKM